MAKFFVDPECIMGSHIYIEDKEDIKHLVKVLRAKAGDEVSVSDKEIWEYTGEIEEITQDQVIIKITDKQRFATEPQAKVTLYQGVPKAGKMETIIQKNVELGVNAIVPVFMGRTVVVEKGNFDKKLERWQKISDEAVKQCKRGIIPEIRRNVNWKEMMEDIRSAGYDLLICPYENEDNRSIKDALREFADAGAGGADEAKVAVVIGPEGGFEDKEIEDMRSLGAEIVTLGKTTLRTETAGMAALAMIMYELEL